MLVATDHRHYVHQGSYSSGTSNFDFRHELEYEAGTTLTYKTGAYGPPITLVGTCAFHWSEFSSSLPYFLVEIPPLQVGAA
ncbi:MAG: hypothetical protein AB7G25_01220 [Sphingomonadaceae bacterium]